MKRFLKKNVWFLIFFGFVLLIITIHPPHCLTCGEYYFNDPLRYFELFSCLILFLIFGYMFLNEKGPYYIYYNGRPRRKKSNNRFYCWMMFVTSIALVAGNIHILNYSHKSDQNVVNALKIWDVLAYFVITAYTLWFWLSKSRGRNIIKKHIGQEKDGTVLFIIFANLILIVIFVAHFSMSLDDIGWGFLSDGITKVLERFEILITLGLIVSVYFLFCSINKKVISNTTDYTVKRDFRTMQKYIDGPTRFIFCIMFTYAIYAWLIGCLPLMGKFFSGAIGFELILSSIVWSHTETF